MKMVLPHSNAKNTVAVAEMSEWEQSFENLQRITHTDYFTTLKEHSLGCKDKNSSSET